MMRILILSIVSISELMPAAAQEKTREVTIYLLKTGTENLDYSMGLIAVTRQVDRRPPLLHSALDSLTKGATAEEEKNKISPLQRGALN